MKVFVSFMSAILILCIGGCRTSSLVTSKKDEDIIEYAVDTLISPVKEVEKPYLIPESLYLENRVRNCDSAIVFMKQVIKPSSTGLNGFKVVGESEKFLAQNKLVDKYFIVPNNQRFYISIECLVGKEIETVLDIFAKPKFHANLLKKYNSKENFVLYMSGYNSFISFYLIGRNGMINKVEYEYTHRVH